MAAVVILSIALVSLLQANNQSILLKGRAQNVTTATLLAREKLSEILIDPESVEESQNGDFGERFPLWRWEVTAEERTSPSTSEASCPTGRAGAATSPPRARRERERPARMRIGPGRRRSPSRSPGPRERKTPRSRSPSTWRAS
jgi:Tfp pilus assembly protein PilV